jgi:hypothetical protein
MATPLRAFLMVRSSAGEWNIAVSRDLEDVLKGWEEREDTVYATGVLHIGFDRPPSREFEAVASGYPGQVLLTSAAKYALPKAFLSTTAAVGLVADAPVFLATAGWGYVADDIEQPTAAHRSSINPAFTDWLVNFVYARPDCEPVLRDAGVFSDDEYIRLESGLARSLRRDLGIYRFRSLIGKEMNDPCAVARNAPPWLAERLFETIDLSVRVSNVFINLGIGRVCDLQEFTLGGLLRTPNFGRKSVDDLLAALDSALMQGPDGPGHVLEMQSEDRLMMAVRRSLLACKERERDIVSRRMGLNGPPETLQQIGDDYSITRERIRQIESKVVNRLIRSEIWDDILTEKLARLLKDREFPLPLMGIEAADSWFDDVGHAPEAMRYILENMCFGGAGIVIVDGVEYCAFLNQAQWENTLAEAKRILSLGSDKGWAEAHCKLVVSGLLPENAREFRSLLWEKASRLCHFSEEGGSNRILRAYGRGADQVVEAILQEADRPLHYTEIAEAANARTKREIEVRRAHNAAASIGILLGRGVFGLRKHLPLNHEQLEELAEGAFQVVTEGPSGRQWHSSELLASLVERSMQEAFLADKYIMNFALTEHAELRSLGRLVWMEKSEEANATLRIDVKQAAISILQQAGRPLRVQQIRQRLVALRGVEQNFQIMASDPLMRVGRSTWGLNDRDSKIKRHDQPILMENIISALRDRGAGIHSSEISSAVPSTSCMDHDVIFSLAAFDPRLRAGVGQYLYLEEWGSSRRESIPDAVSAVLASADRPLRVSEITELVESRIQRSCDNRTVSGCLQALGATINSQGLWTKPSTQDDDVQLDQAEEATFSLPL